MAGFKTHLTVSTLTGIAYGGSAYSLYGLPPAACVLAGGLCSVSGMLPDIDSDSGKPVRESLSFAAAVVSTMLIDRFRQFGLSTQSIVLAAALAYVIVRFGVGALLKRYTVHRGMFHSLPAAMISGELAFLLASGPPTLRLFQAGAVTAGYVSHLILDEIYSVQMKRGRVTAKKSLGTALKLWSHSWGANLSTYAKLALISGVVWIDINQPARFNQVTDALEQQLMDWTGEALWAESEQDRTATGPTGNDDANTPASRGGTKNANASSESAATRPTPGRFPTAQKSARSTSTRYPASSAEEARTFSPSSSDAAPQTDAATPPTIASRNVGPNSRGAVDRLAPSDPPADAAAGSVEAANDNGAAESNVSPSPDGSTPTGRPRIRRLEDLPEVPAGAASRTANPGRR